MAHMHEVVVQVITKSPEDRSSTEISIILPWLKKRTQLLQELGTEVLTDVVRNCEYTYADKDDVIIRQTEMGDSLYIILSGSVSVYIDPNKSGESEEDGQGGMSLEKRRESMRKASVRRGSEMPQLLPGGVTKSLDRSKFGKFVVTFDTGKVFGELALINEESTRNATIIADDHCDFLVINRDLFNQTLKAFQEQEFEERRRFISSHPLFKSWQPKFKKLLEMSLIKESHAFDSPIIRQGDPVDGLKFVTSGRAKVVIEQSRHTKQYPSMYPLVDHYDVFELEQIRPVKKKGSNQKKPRARSLSPIKQDHVAVRRKAGYAAAERKNADRNIVLCSVGAGEIIGDTELVMGMDTYMQSVICTSEAEVYHLTLKNFERLVSKKNSTLLDMLKMALETKLKTRINSVQGQRLPILKHILFKLTEKKRPEPKPIPPLKGTKELPEKDILFQHLLDQFAHNKAELIEPHVPGAVYFREIMREKARIRTNLKKQTKAYQRPSELKRRLHRIRKPRTTIALRNDLERQVESTREVEKQVLLKEYRKLEMENLQRVYQDASKSWDGFITNPSNKHLNTEPQNENQGEIQIQEETNSSDDVQNVKSDEAVVKEEGPLTDTEDDVNIEKTSQGNIDDSHIQEETVENKTNINNTSGNDNGVQKPDQKPHLKSEKRNISNDKHEHMDPIFELEDDEDFQKLRRTFITESKLSVLSNPEKTMIKDDSDENKDLEEIRKGAGSAEPNLESYEPILITETEGRLQTHPPDGDLPQKHSVLPPIPVSSPDHPAFPMSAPKSPTAKKRRARLKFLSSQLRRKINSVQENPQYRDWETNEGTLQNLEERVRQFAIKHGTSRDPIVLTKLKRFEKGDFEGEPPKPGGKVYVRRSECRLQQASQRGKPTLVNHRHTRYHILPALPNYDNLKLNKMLWQHGQDTSRSNIT